MTNIIPKNIQCHKCGMIKPLAEFHKHKSSKWGIAKHCKACRTLSNRKRYQEQKKTQKYKMARIARQAKRTPWHTAFPKKQAAKNTVTRMVRAGKIPGVKTQICVDCGRQAQNYHHEDYGKPLEIIPLCVSCHMKRHK